MIRASQRAIDMWAYRHLSGYAIDDVPVVRLSNDQAPTLYFPAKVEYDTFYDVSGDAIRLNKSIPARSSKVVLYQKERKPGEWVQCLVAWDDEYGLFLSPVAPANIQAWMGTSYTFATRQEQETIPVDIATKP